jgi:hypothetical protein
METALLCFCLRFLFATRFTRSDSVHSQRQRQQQQRAPEFRLRPAAPPALPPPCPHLLPGVGGRSLTSPRPLSGPGLTLTAALNPVPFPSPPDLQEMVAVSGWDGFLRLRSSVFVMHADSDVLREQQRVGDGDELDGGEGQCRP